MQAGIKKHYYLLIWISCILLISLTIGNITKTSVNDWYLTLNKSPLTPPSYVFGIVWSILYIMIASSGWLIWQQKNQLLKKLFITQMLLNWLWTPLFFGFNLITPALICLLLLAIVLSRLVFNLLKEIKQAGLLLAPYYLWSLFALYLNFYIWIYN
jgi:benzodiazapine receptor